MAKRMWQLTNPAKSDEFSLPPKTKGASPPHPIIPK